MPQYKSTKHPGLRYREHKNRKHGIRFDRYYVIRYQRNGKQICEALGWASEGWTESKAISVLSEIKENIRTGRNPQSLKEKRELARQEQETEAEEKRLEQLVRITFYEFFITTYLPLAKQGNKKEKSWKTEESWFRNWINPVIGSKILSDIAPIHIEQIKSRMLKDGKAPRSIQYCLATVRQVFNVASIHGYFEGKNPTQNVRVELSDNKRDRSLDTEEAEALLNELKRRSLQLHDMALLSLHCGLRAGEIFSLTWDCVDIEDEKILLKDTKNGKNRYAYMTSDVKNMLITQWTGKNVGLVFKNRKGEKIIEISDSFDRAVDAIGLNDGVTDRRYKVVFHTLRHTFASWLVQAGETLYSVKELMGHKSISMTERYSHMDKNGMRAVIERADARRKEAKENGQKIIPLKEGLKQR